MGSLTAKDIVDTLCQFTADEESWYLSSPESDYWHWGVTRYRGQRVAAVAELAAKSFGGNIAEIGCGRGLTTVHLAEVARQHGRRVIAVDPWKAGVPGCLEGYYEEFLERVEPYADILDVVRLSSRSKKAKAILSQPLCFAFVDGRHTYQYCLSDIKAVHHAGIICVDDVQNNWKMLRAFTEGAGKRRKIAHPWCKEKYIR